MGVSSKVQMHLDGLFRAQVEAKASEGEHTLALRFHLVFAKLKIYSIKMATELLDALKALQIDPHWAISEAELQFAAHLGQGGFGSVFKARYLMPTAP